MMAGFTIIKEVPAIAVESIVEAAGGQLSFL